MKAACWEGKHEIALETVPDPTLLKRRDAIVRVTSSAICGSDLHLYNGFIPSLVPGDILGHEFMGEVVDIGPEVREISVGDRVVVAATVACGKCFFCEHDLWSLCDNSNPKGGTQEKLFGHSTSAIFGYSHLFGGYAGGQAEYVRVPYADVGMLRIPEGIPDEKVLFLSDILPTGWMGAENCGISGGETVAVWGCGPVGQMAIRSLRLLGAGRIIAIDRYPERLAMARSAGAETLDYEQVDVLAALKETTGGMGPDACLDAVGMEAHGHGFVAHLDEVKQRVRLESDRPFVLRQMILACRKGGTISILGVYSGLIDNFPMGVAFNKGLTFRMGQLNAQKYLKPLLKRIELGELDPSFVVTHRLPLADVAQGYRIFDKKSDGCIKVVLRP